MDELPFAEMSVVVISAKDRWGKHQGVPQEREDRLPEAQARAKWSKVYGLFNASTEDEQDDVFAAVNAYLAKNGTSPYGRYARDIKTGSGVTVPAASVIKITGRLEGDIRQFMRGRMKESYEALRYTGYLTNDSDALNMAEEVGIPRHLVHLLGDWLKGCEYLTAEEQDVYKSIRDGKIEAARLRRAGVPDRRADVEDAPIEVASPPSKFAAGGYQAISY